MSFINRIEAANLLNRHGQHVEDPWRPRIRNFVVNTRGRNTLLRIPNGGGKSTICGGVLALMSRDRKLVQQLRATLPPRSAGSWGHVRIEFLNIADPGDLLPFDDEPIQGETWVFGVCGFRGEKSGSLKYYYYPGSLTDVPIMKSATAFASNDEFRQMIEGESGRHWDVSHEKWDAEMAEHVLPEAVAQMVRFQHSGGSDKGADLFEVTGAGFEQYETKFFYQVIAPALLSGLMGLEAERGENSFEDVMHASLASIYGAKRKSERKQKALQLLDDAVTSIGKASEAATSAKAAREELRLEERAVGAEVATIRALAQDASLGMPATETPDAEPERSMVNWIFQSPEESQPRIMVNAICALTGERVDAVNQRAGRKGIAGRQLTQLIDYSCVIDRPGSPKGGGHIPRSYSVEEAYALISQAPSFVAGMDAGRAKDRLSEAISWIDRHVDRNPFRKSRIERDLDLQSNGEKLRAAEEDSRRKGKELSQLEMAKAQLTSDEALVALARLSQQFTETELEHPAETLAAMKREMERLARASREFHEKDGALKNLRLPWAGFVERFGADASPSAIKADLVEHQRQLRSKAAELDQSRRRMEERKTPLEQAVGQAQKSLASKTAELDVLLGLEQFHDGYLQEYPDETIAGLESRLRQSDTALGREVDSAEAFVADLHAAEKVLAQHLVQFPGEAPAAVLAGHEAELRNLGIEQSGIETELSDARRERMELDGKAISTPRAFADANAVLSRAGLAPQPLHEAVSTALHDDRVRAQAIQLLSAVLHAPVFDRDEDAARAARCLDEARTRIPVFRRDALLTYVGTADVTALDETTVSTFIVGMETFEARCVLDPRLLESERTRLDALIVRLHARIKAIAERISAIGSRSKIRADLNAALAAEAKDPASRLGPARDRVSVLKARRESVSRRLTGDELERLRSAESFVKKGGKVTLKALTSEVDSITRKIVDDTREVESLAVSIRGATDESRQLRDQAASILDDTTAILLNDASQYVSAGGPAFDADRQSSLALIEADKARADARDFFKANLEAQQRVLALKAQTGEPVGAKYERVKAEIGALGKLIDAFKAEDKRLVSERDDLRSREKALDQLVVIVQGLARHVRTLESTDAPLLDEVVESVEALKHSGSTTAFIDGVGQLSTRISEINIEARTGRLIALKASYRQCLDRMMDQAKTAARSNAIAVVERERLNGVNGIEEADGVIAMHESLSKTLQKEREECEQLSQTESDIRTKKADVLGHLIASGSDGLARMKRIAQGRDGDELQFRIDAKVVSSENAKALADALVARFEDRFNDRSSQQEAGTEEAALERFDGELKKEIRTFCYPQIFESPKVQFRSGALRAGDAFHSVGETLSNGQKSALQIAWVTRLNEFHAQRAAVQGHRSSSRKKAARMFHTFLMIDGLFSNLSDDKLIDDTMSGLKTTQKNFQVIGLMHNADQKVSLEMFPTQVTGKLTIPAGGGVGWLKVVGEDNPLGQLGASHAHYGRHHDSSTADDAVH